jgi:hypothetical protein
MTKGYTFEEILDGAAKAQPILDFEDKSKPQIFLSCDQVRSEIKAFLKKHGVSVNRFAKLIGTSAAPIHKFLALKGFEVGAASDVYYKAYDYLGRVRVAEGLGESRVISKNKEKSEKAGQDQGIFMKMYHPYCIDNLKKSGKNMRNGAPQTLLHVSHSYKEWYNGYLDEMNEKWN